MDAFWQNSILQPILAWLDGYIHLTGSLKRMNQVLKFVGWNMMGFVLIGFLAFPGPVGSVTWQDVWEGEEPGQFPCQGLLDRGKNHARLSLRGSAWLYGYLTAHGDFNGHRAIEIPGPPTQYSREIVKQCLKAPQTPFRDVVRKVIAGDPVLKKKTQK